MNNVFIVSLKDQVHRRNLLVNNGINPSFVSNYYEASDFRNIDKNELSSYYNPKEAFSRYGRYLRPAEVGCAMSHIKIYEKIVNDELDYGIVLEDDIIPVVDRFEDEVDKIIRLIQEFELEKKSCIFHLGVKNGSDKKSRKVLFSGDFKESELLRVLASEVDSIWLTHAYIITKKAAKNILINEQKIKYVADDWQIRLKNKTLDYLFYTNEIFEQNLLLDTSVQGGSHWGVLKKSPFIIRCFRFAFNTLIKTKAHFLLYYPLVIKRKK